MCLDKTYLHLITTICYLLFIGSIHFMIFNKAIFNFNISILDCSHDFIFLTGYKLGFNYLKAKRFVDAIDVCHKVCSFFLIIVTPWKYAQHHIFQ